MDHSHHHSGMSTMGHPSAPAPPLHPLATSGPHSHGHSAHWMPIIFYFVYKKVELLFAWLLIYFAMATALAFLAVFLLALAYEGLKRARERLRTWCSAPPRPEGSCPEETPRQQLLSAAHLLQTALHGLQLALSYLLMLTAMTYNAYLALVLLARAGAGYWLFGGKKAEHVDSQNLPRNKAPLPDAYPVPPEDQRHQNLGETVVEITGLHTDCASADMDTVSLGSDVESRIGSW
ncbi:high affinity copper uptake protein 1-like [Sorex araneus]|uniref:high affinity copper uptake protein 1-like n=1 Tax=Sorex araneus TaxID=42254 RepID=UPI002433C5C0|nr:high affinity copper uptake protein 1-like [Sorex araneus]XP_054986291.1 high affinity copper uptake protein 1-like [Sorex araneus]